MYEKWCPQNFILNRNILWYRKIILEMNSVAIWIFHFISYSLLPTMDEFLKAITKQLYTFFFSEILAVFFTSSLESNRGSTNALFQFWKKVDFIWCQIRTVWWIEYNRQSGLWGTRPGAVMLQQKCHSALSNFILLFQIFEICSVVLWVDSLAQVK